MRGAFLIAILMITSAVMMGCDDMFITCAGDEDCLIDGFDVGMTCNLDTSPQQRCEEMFGWVTELLPIPIPIPICEGLSTDPGVCESSWSW